MTSGGRCGWLAIAVVLLATAPVGATVSVSDDHGTVHVHAPAYDATVEPDGSMTHLVAGGEELLNSTVDVSRGTYLFHAGGRPKLADVKVDGATVTARGDAAEVVYAFGDDGVRLAVTNRTAQPMSFFLIPSAGVRAVASDHGDRAATPANAEWPAATFYYGRATLCLTGADREWGPWVAGLQVWDVGLKPNESRTLTATVGTMSAGDAKWVTAVAASAWVPGRPVAMSDVTVWSPRDWQVVQRRTATQGVVRVSGRAATGPVRYRITGTAADGTAVAGDWHDVPLAAGCFGGTAAVPAGGWYAVSVVAGSRRTGEATVDHVGVGEVSVKVSAYLDPVLAGQ